MNRSEYYNWIEEKLSVLTFRIENRGKLNILDYHTHSENFYRDFFNLLYGWDLKNLNENQQNIEGIDLIDEKNRLIVQVSATNTKHKIESSLKKGILKNYKTYTFKFILIARNANKLRGLSYNIPDGLNFIPQEDIYDVQTVLKTVNASTIDELEKIYEFIKKELDHISNVPKISSDLSAIINILAKENLDITAAVETVNSFEIEKKIQFNKLNSSRLLIEDYKIYYNLIEKLYSNYNEMGVNKSLAVLNTFRKEYIDNMLKYKGDELYKIISKNIIEKIKTLNCVENISEEALSLCVDILMVDAFIRCKIFENPNNYAYAITR